MTTTRVASNKIIKNDFYLCLFASNTLVKIKCEIK